MRVIRLSGSKLVAGEAPKPEPGPGELLIRVFAAGVTPSELTWYPTTHTKSGEPRVGAIPGHEFSGVVEAAGAGFSAGDEVYGMNDWFAEGATADYCVAPPDAVAAKPAVLTHVEAASVPIGALTAWQGLFDRAHLQPGERVLVQGGAGAVGIYAVQLAKRHGAHVIATASAHNLEFLAGLGADEVIDYREPRFEDRAGKVDVVFDAVGGEVLERSWQLLADPARMVTIAAGGETADGRIKRAFFIVEANQKQLIEVAGLLDQGQLHPAVDAVAPLAQAPDAYQGKVPRQGRGKVVIEVERT